MATTYWHKHPRGFANECDIVRANDPVQVDLLSEQGYERLTRRALAVHVRWLNGENDAWGSNRAFGRISLRAVLHDNDYSADYRDL